MISPYKSICVTWYSSASAETSTLSDIEGKFPGITADATFKLEAYNNMKNGKLHVTGKLKFREGPFRFKESANFKIADWLKNYIK